MATTHDTSGEAAGRSLVLCSDPQQLERAAHPEGDRTAAVHRCRMRTAARMTVALSLAIGCGTSGDEAGKPKPGNDRAAPTSGDAGGKRKEQVVQSPGAKAIVAAEASLQQVVLSGPGAALMERAQALESALRAFGRTIPKGKDLDQLSADIHYLIGLMESLTAQALEEPATRRRVGAVVHRKLSDLQLTPLSWKPELADTQVTLPRGAICDQMKELTATMGAKCPNGPQELPPCCQGSACGELVTVDMEVLNSCVMDAGTSLCSKGSAPTSWPQSCGSLALH